MQYRVLGYREEPRSKELKKDSLTLEKETPTRRDKSLPLLSVSHSYDLELFFLWKQLWLAVLPKENPRLAWTSQRGKKKCTENGV